MALKHYFFEDKKRGICKARLVQAVRFVQARKLHSCKDVYLRLTKGLERN